MSAASAAPQGASSAPRSPGAGPGGGRQPFILVANPKMTLGYSATLTWADSVATLAAASPLVRDRRVELVLAPSIAATADVARRVAGSGVQLAAQNVAWAESGPFSGELPATLLVEIGCTIAQVGAPERRALFHEDDATIAAKLHTACRNGLAPMLFVGEEQPGTAANAVRRALVQFESATAGARVRGVLRTPILAYAPAWSEPGGDLPPIEHIRAVLKDLHGWAGNRPIDDGPRVLCGTTLDASQLATLGADAGGAVLDGDAANVERIRDHLNAVAAFTDPTAEPHTSTPRSTP